MSATDFERNDGLDGLSSDELEARAFGPEPAQRQILGGFAPRPGAAQLRAVRPRRPGRRRIVAGVLAAGVGVAAVLLLTVATVDPEHFGVHDHEQVYVIDDFEVDAAASGFYFDDEGVYDRIEESATYRRALDEEAVDVFMDEGGIR